MMKLTKEQIDHQIKSVVRFITKNKKRVTAASVILVLGAGTVAGSYLYSPRDKQPAMVTAETSVEAVATSWEVPETTTIAVPETTAEAWVPTPGELNLTHFFPEGADQSDMTKSLAGEAFKTLMTHDVDWMSSIYDYSDITPAQMAKRLGRSTQSVMGRYNPKDEKHDRANSDTWTINSFKRIRMTAQDGDGNAISPYSNVLDIMSMANLYTYFKGVEDYDLFLSYSKELWELSHSYSVSMSNVYYCDGCMSEESELKEMEELESEAKAVALGLSKEGESGMILSNEQNSTAEENGDTESSDINDTQGISDEATAAEEQSTVIEVGKMRAQQESAAASLAAANAETAEESAVQESTSAIIVSNHRSDSSKQSAAETSPAEPETQWLSDETAAEPGAEAAAHESTAAEEQTNATASDAASVPSETKHAPDKSGTSEPLTDCPGHVDLIIHMKIIGLDEAKNLFEKDTIGNDSKNLVEGGWPGWNQYTKASVRLLSSQDWFAKYGLTVSSISSGNPLTEGEIEAYMAELPADLSKARKDVIRFALSSVGKVPYYWGGKPSAPNYAANSFGVLTTPDEKGRVLSGLDCSGWINWVYWSATGKRLPYESTSGLAVLGTKVGRGDLKPGDIIVRTGGDAHVIMFLGWTADGRIRCIHESSASVNNVTVGIRDANWPYYRKLIE